MSAKTTKLTETAVHINFLVFIVPLLSFSPLNAVWFSAQTCWSR